MLLRLKSFVQSWVSYHEGQLACLFTHKAHFLVIHMAWRGPHEKVQSYYFYQQTYFPYCISRGLQRITKSHQSFHCLKCTQYPQGKTLTDLGPWVQTPSLYNLQEQGGSSTNTEQKLLAAEASSKTLDFQGSEQKSDSNIFS